MLSIFRFQNTACTGDNGESGTCKTQEDCANLRGSEVGSCANGFGR